MIKFKFDNNQTVQFNVITSVNCSDRIQTVYRTWGKLADHLYFYSDHDDINNNVYKVSDNQRDCGLKTANRLKQIINEGIKYDWYFFVDDDSCINFKALNVFINNHTPNKVYGKPAGDWPNHPYIQGGCGILVPGNILSKLVESDIEDDWLHPASGYGDLWWSYLNKKCSIPLEAHGDEFYSIYHSHEEDLLKQKDLSTIVTVHPVRTFEAMEYYTNLLNPFINNKSVCVITCFKNEAHIIDEWVTHYIDEGIDHIYVIDNGSTDNYLENLQPYIDRGYVTLFLRPEPYQQSNHLTEIFHKVKHKHKWCVMVDMDEFMFPVNHNSFKEYLADKDEWTTLTANWTNFGSCESYEQPASVIDGFLWKWKRFPRYAGDPDLHTEGKQIVRSDVIVRMHIHDHEIPANIKKELIDNDNLKNFHYQLQSREYFDRVKAIRGDACDASCNHYRNEAYFRDRDRREVYDDTLKLRREKRRNENS